MTMKKLALIAVFAACSVPVFAEMLSIDLASGDVHAPAPARAVCVQAASTNLSGTLVVRKVTPIKLTWTDDEILTNVVFTTSYSNLTHTVTNTVISAWGTNTVEGVLVTNLVACATNAIPVYSQSDLSHVTTNRFTSQAVHGRAPYTTVLSRTITHRPVIRTSTRAFTNEITSLTLASGFATTNLSNVVIAPGDYLTSSGSAFDGGRVQIVFER